MAQNEIERNNYINKMNEPSDNVFLDRLLNITEINKSIFDNKNSSYNSSPNYKNSKSNFEYGKIKGFNDKNIDNYIYNNRLNKNKNKNNKKIIYNKSIGNTTPNRSFLTKSKLSINSKNNSGYKNIKRKNSSNNNYNKSNISNLNKNLRINSPFIKHDNNFMRKDPYKDSNIINKLTEEVEHIKNYCNELKRQFDNHCIIKNERKEFDNIKKENIKLIAEVSILKDDVAELMKKYSLINNKIDCIQQENNNLKNQNKNLMNFISIISNNNSNAEIKRLKSLNMNQNNNISYNSNINQNIFSKNSNNESMNIINLINNNSEITEINNKLIKNKNIQTLNSNSNYMSKTSYNFNKNNNFNSEKIDFSISNSINSNIEKLKEEPLENNYKTINNNINDYINNNYHINLESKINNPCQTMEQTKKIKDNSTDIVSLIQSNFNLTNQFKKDFNNKQNRYLIPKNID